MSGKALRPGWTRIRFPAASATMLMTAEFSARELKKRWSASLSSTREAGRRRGRIVARRVMPQAEAGPAQPAPAETWFAGHSDELAQRAFGEHAADRLLPGAEPGDEDIVGEDIDRARDTAGRLGDAPGGARR